MSAPVRYPQSVCLEADKLVKGSRGSSYGHPTENDTRIAALWSVVLGVTVPPELVPLCMIQVKVARELHSPRRDNRVDIAGYAQTLDMHYEGKEASNASLTDTSHS